MADEDDDIAGFLVNEERRAQGRVFSSLDDDPEKGARAIQLAEVTGVPPAVVHGDLEHYDNQTKAKMSGQLVSTNQFLKGYINSHDLAATVSNDDLGQLDQASQSIQKIGNRNLAAAFIEGFGKGAGPGGFGSWIFNTTGGEEFVKKHPYSAIAYSFLGAPYEAFRVAGGVISGSTEMAGQWAQDMGFPNAAKHGEQFGQFIQDPGFWASIGIPIPKGQATAPRGPGLLDTLAHNKSLEDAIHSVDLYVRSGKEPPVGLHPILDMAKLEQMELDIQNLGEALKESAKSATRERSPELYAAFVRQHVGDAKIGISAEKVAELYGDKLPAPDDNILGWVPRISEQLETAKGTGLDIEVPLADFLARVDPKIAKELEDHVRMRPEGVTKEEAKLAKEGKVEEAPVDEAAPPVAPVDVVRKTAGLEPFEVYHGSPHQFEAFDISKIGTGEGAQSYGHGLYFAENRAVAEDYAKKLSSPTGGAGAQNSAGMKLSDFKEPAIYRTRIKANKEHFLDWDKALNEQTEHVQEAIDKIDDIEKHKLTDNSKGSDLYEQLANYGFDGGKKYKLGAGHEEATRMLREAGIPGIKYLDQGSRGGKDSTFKIVNKDGKTIQSGIHDENFAAAEAKKVDGTYVEELQETHNIVLFDDKLAEITHKNDVPVNQPKRVKPQQLSLDLPKQLDERDPFQRGTLIGVADYDRYLKLIEQRQAEDLAHATKKAETLARKQMTTAWKEDEIAIRAQVVEDLNRQPVFSADTFFRDGTFADERVEGSHRIGTDFLTREEQAALPPSYTAKNGIDPDTIAWRHGYSSGQDMVNDLIGLNQQREASGKNPAAYRRASIDAEVSRRMDLKYGEAKKSMLEDAKDQALSDTQIDLLHEETLGMAMKAGVEFELSKGDIAAMVKERMDVTLMSEANSDKMLAAAGRAGRAEASALLKEDYAEAFRQRAKKEFDAIIAKQTMEIEKARDSFDKTAKTFRARSLPSVAQEYTNAIHDVLMRVGERVNRSVQDLAEEMKRDGHDSLADFIKAQAEATFGGVQIPIPEFLLKPEWRGTIDQLTTEEFKQVKETVDVLNKLGRDELKIIRGGESADKAALLAEMKEKVQTFPLRGVKDFTGTPTLGQKITELPRSALASSTAMETLFHRFDRADPRGVFNKWLVYPLADAANNKNVLQRKYAKPYGELGLIEGKNKLVTSPLIEPMSITKENPQGNPVATFTRGNVQTMIYNAGNRAQWEKFAKGWNADPDTLMSWLHQNSTKEMWDRAQKQGDTLFKPLFEQVQDMYHRINGVAPEKIPLEKIQTPFGEYDGWYHPLIKDASREYYIDAEGNRISGQSKKQMGPGVFDNTDGFHVRTANGFTKSRTNAFYPIDLNADMIPIRLDQMIHDLAFREAIINAEKLLRDPGLRNDVAKHYGKEYSDGFLPYLKGIAGQADIPSKAYADAMRVSEYLRKNTIGTYIGFNPGTPAKHGPTALVMSIAQVGLRPFARAFAETSFEKGLNAIEMAVGKREFLEATRDLFSKSEFTNSSNLEFAMKNSEELQRRKRNWADTISGEHANIYGEGNLRDKVAEAGSAIVAESDMISAAPTWLAAYRTAMKENPVHGEAVDIANAAVRKAHGSTAVTNLPAIVRGAGPFGSWFTTVYGFFGTVMQRRIEIFHTLNDMYHLGKEGEIKEAGKKLSDAMWHTMTYVVWPTMVEEWVTGFTTDDRRGWGTHLLTASLHGLGSSVIFVRDMVHAITTGGDPNAGMITSVLHDHKKLLDDLKKGKKVFTKETAGKTVQEFITSFGLLTGLTPKELGILAHASIDLSTGQAKPKNFTEWRNLMMRGQTKSRVVK